MHQNNKQIQKQNNANEYLNESLQSLISKKHVSNKSTYTLNSFKIIKYSKVQLEFTPIQIEFRDPYMLLVYGQNVPYIDIFSKSGKPEQRINVQSCLD